VLTQDITLNSAHTPIGTGAGANAFQGKFYGAGHSITVGAGFSGGTYTGIFGYTDNNAEIRDLTVNYSASASGAANVGGIAGYAAGNTVIRNCAVGGSGVLSASGESLGGIAGRMAATAKIVNARAGLAVSGTGYVGGVVGYIASGGPNLTILDMITASAAVSATGTTGYVGGIVGRSESEGLITTVTRSGGTISGNGVYYGGIAGSVLNTSLIDCRWEGRLELSGTVAGRSGGIAGEYQTTTGAVSPPGETGTNPLIRGARAGGTITTSGAGISNEHGVGGLFGQVIANSTATRPKMRDCVFSGKIGESAAAPFKTTAGDFNAGGVIGVMGTSTSIGPEIENCHARAQAFFVEYAGTGVVYIGGFNGYTNGGAVSVCSAEGAINLNKTGSTGIIYFGGFTGYVNNTILPGSPPLYRTSEFVRCYATANLTSTSAVTQYVAGFLAYSKGYTTTIANCYATGDVYVNGSAGTIMAGGFVGDTDTSGILHAVNCYATGDVTTTSSGNSTVGIGGLFANVSGNVTLTCCFAGGTVSVSGGSLFAGGIAGYNNGHITYSAAYGGSVSAAGSSSRVANRIWGGTSGGTGSNNYAFKTMRTGTATSNGGAITWTVPGDAGTPPLNTSNQGANATGDDFRSGWFWQNTLDFKSSETITGMVNGSTATIVSGPAWGFSTVFGKGHPVLLNADGSVMGGQMAAP
jgi:hypothetical protein